MRASRRRGRRPGAPSLQRTLGRSGDPPSRDRRSVRKADRRERLAAERDHHLFEERRRDDVGTDLSERHLGQRRPLVVVTPELSEFVRVTSHRHELDLRILCDLDHVLPLSFGILFRVPADLRARLLDVPLRFGVGEWMMPVQSTFGMEELCVIAASQTDVEPSAVADPWPCLRHLRDHH